jgi:hypothetical protein
VPLVVFIAKFVWSRSMVEKRKATRARARCLAA